MGWAGQRHVACAASSSGGDNSNEPDPRLKRLRSFMLGIGMPGMGMVNPTLLSGGMPAMPGGAMQDRSPRGGSKPPPPAQADPWAGPARQPGLPEEWGRSAWEQDWDPAENLNDDDLDVIADEAEEEFRRGGRGTGPPRDKWITPLLDFQSVSGAVDPDQERTEDTLQVRAVCAVVCAGACATCLGVVGVVCVVWGHWSVDARVSDSLALPCLSACLPAWVGGATVGLAFVALLFGGPSCLLSVPRSFGTERVPASSG
jgi:hypothetical protein